MIENLKKWFKKEAKSDISLNETTETKEKVKNEEYYQNTPYTSKEVYFAFYDAAYNHFITADKWNENVLVPSTFSGVFRGLRYKIVRRKPQTWLTTYHVELSDEETGEILAYGGEVFWRSSMDETAKGKLQREHKLNTSNFYVLHPETSMSEYVLEIVEHLMDLNHKKDIMDKTSESIRKDREKREKENTIHKLENKYGQKLNQV